MITGISLNTDRKGMNCLESYATSVVKWLGRDYDMMFAESWNYRFEGDDSNACCKSGSYISLGKHNDSWNLLERYHGVKFKFNEPENSINVLNILRKELEEERPVIIKMDSYWCTYLKQTYHKLHEEHSVLVVGLDEEAGLIHCRDHETDGANLTIGDFQQGLGFYLTYEITGCEVSEFDWKEILSTTLDNLRTTNTLIEKEVHCSVKHAPLYLNFLNIANSRITFSKTLRFLAIRNNVHALIPLADQLDDAGEKWNTVRRMLIKLTFMLHHSQLHNRIGIELDELVNEERSIAAQLKVIIELD